MTLSLKRIRSFAAVADHGSFSRAAEELHISQPALSAQIRELEAHLGVPLLSRTTRLVRLTADGERFLARARRLLSDLDTLVIEMQDQAALRRGRVAVACVPTIASYLFPQTVSRFVANHPGVSVELFDLTSAEVEQHVVDGAVDFGICGPTETSSSIQFAAMATDTFIALVPKSHVFAKQRSVTIEQLRQHPLIAMRRGTNVRAALEDAFASAGIKLQPAFEVMHHYSVAGLVEAGLGIGILPEMTFAALGRHRLRMVPILRPVIRRKIGVATKHGEALSPAAKELVRTFGEVIAEHTLGRARQLA